MRADGAERVISSRGRVLFAGDEPVTMLGTAQDVTDQRQAERLREDILSAVSHELRTPLTAVLGFPEAAPPSTSFCPTASSARRESGLQAGGRREEALEVGGLAGDDGDRSRGEGLIAARPSAEEPDERSSSASRTTSGDSASPPARATLPFATASRNDPSRNRIS